MNPQYSLFLDLARLTAATLVFLHHAEYLVPKTWLSNHPVASFGHDAVVFFFILSGFVIGFVANTREHSVREYAISRASRMYSVAIPSLLLALALCWIGSAWFGGEYLTHMAADWGTIVIKSVLFVNNNSFFIGGTIPTNGPYWSVSYEAWYYVVFGFAFYMRTRIGIVLALAAAVFSGRAMLLFPIWVSGYFLYKFHTRIRIRKSLGYAMICLALTLYLTARILNFDDSLQSSVEALIGGAKTVNGLLGFRKRFVPDHMIAMLFLAIMVGVYAIRDDLHFLQRFNREITLLASFTFPLYLFHYPLVVFFAKFLGSLTAILLSVLVTVLALGWATERFRTWMRTQLTRTMAHPIAA